LDSGVLDRTTARSGFGLGGSFVVKELIECQVRDCRREAVEQVVSFVPGLLVELQLCERHARYLGSATFELVRGLPGGWVGRSLLSGERGRLDP
jgi:hypothetical protein